MYAVVETGGKQYRVVPGQIIDVESLDFAEGETVNLDRVLLIGDGDKVVLGKPTIEGASVTATSQGNGRGKKVIVFKYKPKVRYKRRTGHRQTFTRIRIDQIISGKDKLN